MKFPFFLLVLFAFIDINAQDSTSIVDYTRLPDKVYMHLDKNLYSPGDTIWIKSYAFHRNNMQLSDNSYALHIQMLSQEGSDIGNYKMLMVNGMGCGQIPVYDKMKPGFYQLVAHTGHMKNFGKQFFYKTTIEVRDKNSRMSIKSYFDKDKYRLGDTAKVTFHIYDEFQTPIPKQTFRYDLMHQEMSLKKGTLKSNDDGTVTASFPIDNGTISDPPCLKLSYYNTYDYENPIKQKVYVPIVDDVLHLDFFPEGGDLVKGIFSKVAFKGVDALGEAVAVTGVLQKNGSPIMNVNTLYDGMGFFSLKPSEANYTVKVTQPEGIDSVYILPHVIASGYHIMFVRQNDTSVYLQVDHNYGDVRNVKLWISQYDKFLDLYDLEVNGSRYFAIPKDALPKGLVTFTITDNKDIPVAERLVFIPNKENDIKLSVPHNVFSQRKKVKVNLSLENAESKAHLSIAVVDSILGNSPYVGRDNIKSYALLSSELRGRVKDINSYLATDRVSQGRCDLMVMTHGWRRYSWVNNEQQLDSMTMLNFEVISGKVMRNKKPEVKAQMTVFTIGDLTNYVDFETDSLGRFKITPSYENRRSQRLLLMAKSSKGKGNVRIIIYNTDTLLFGEVVEENSDNAKALVYDYDNFVNGIDDKDEEPPFLSYEAKMLNELVVYGERVDPRDEGAISEAIVAFAAGALSGEDLVGGFGFGDFVEQASHRAMYDRSAGRITVRSLGGGSTSSEDFYTSSSGFDTEVGAEIYVNDMRWGKDVGSLDFLTKDDIAEIVVLDPAGAYSMYGQDGEYGVILVRTYSNNFNNKEREMNKNMTIFGRFIDSKEYYKQAYETKQQDSLVVVDNRITLHWEPFIETDVNGQASFEFYTDDIGGAKQIVIQGIDEKGNLFYQTKEFDVQLVNH